MVTKAMPDRDDAAPSPAARTSEATQSNPVRPGLRFSETMTGLVNAGSTDPAEGYGNPGAVAFALRATVTIADLPAFFGDPEHRGRWSAGGSLPVWGGPVRSTEGGDFRLFQRMIGANSKPVREMVYDTEITVGERAYALRGRKIIEPGPPWRFWPATTTLYVRIFEPDRPDVVVAAGILRLTALGFLRQLGTMRVTGDFPMSVKLTQAWLFAKFFAGSVARTYILERRW